MPISILIFVPILIAILPRFGRTLRAMFGVVTTAPLPGSAVRMSNAVITGQIALLGAVPLLGRACEERCGNEREHDNEDTHRTS